MKIITMFAGMFLFGTTVVLAQINNSKTETVKVFGNCEMCKDGIESAANKKKVSKADWNKDSKMAAITYDSKKTTLSTVLKTIALAGFDNDQYLAPDDAYAKLPDCCKYSRENKAMAKMDKHDQSDKMNTVTKMGDEKNKMEMKDGKEIKAEEKVAEDHTKHVDQPMDVKKNEMKQTNMLKPVADNYFLLKDALVNTDAAKTSAAAKKLSEAIAAVDMSKLSEKDHITWRKVLNPLKTATASITTEKSIAKQRILFMGLSENMYTLIKATKPAGTVYYQHCPMANNGKGANWLSKEAAIKNPYYGSMMLNCGSVAETIE